MKNIFPILLLAAVLRLWNIAGVPPTASMDEASIGYNAYSVIKTGVDEFGQFPLISQRGYDDWRRSTYLLFTTPFIALFGLNAVSIRLPAIILSVLTIWAMYHIVQLLFLKRSKFSDLTALTAALLLAISPWHIYISRLGHESNAYLSFFVFGILFFLWGIKRKKVIILSIIFFYLSMISYYAGQVIVPILGCSLLSLYRTDLWLMAKTDKKIRKAFILLGILFIPIMWSVFSPSAMVRFQGTSVFSPNAHPQEFARRVELRNLAVQAHDLIGTVRYNRRVFAVQVFFEGYISHFRSSWLFSNSGNDAFKAPHSGLLYVWELPFLLLGIFIFLRNTRLDKRAKKVIILWLLFAPIPGSIATQAPHAMRAYVLVPALAILAGFGVAFLLTKLGKYISAGLFGMAMLAVFGLWIFSTDYFIAFPKEQSKSFHFALSKAIPYVKANGSNYEKVVFSNEDNLYQSYMLFLYYTCYDPALYQSEGGTQSGGYAETHAFGKYEFRPVKKDEILEPNILYVGNTKDFSDEIKPVAEFANLDGTIAIQAVTL